MAERPQYGYQHQRTRALLLPKAYGKACPLCGVVMLKGQALDLDHSRPVVLGGTHGDRIAHASCNRSAGARLSGTRARLADPGSDLAGPAW